MASYAFRLVNVFVPELARSATALNGNPLCVFEDAAGMDESAMLALTRQFNLSETTFILPASAAGASARVRIFTPSSDLKSSEMRFAGHPSLGTAHVLRSIGRSQDHAVLDLPAGLVPVDARGDVWTLTAPFSGKPGLREEPSGAAAIAAQVGLTEADLAGPPLWLDTGTEQLIVPVRHADRVNRAQPSSAVPWARNRAGRANVYLFAPNGRTEDGRDRILSRFFIQAPGAGIYEDPGTGSACANLGGWMLATNRATPLRALIDQGIAMQRHCRLELMVQADGRIQVGGRVMEVARGSVTLPDL